MMQRMRIELGKRIRELRKAHEWSQEVLGGHADLNPTCVGGIERGERNVSFDNLCKLAGAFNLTLAQFFDFPKIRQGKRDLLRAKLSGIMRHRSEEDLELFLSIAGAVDNWKLQSRQPQASYAPLAFSLRHRAKALLLPRTGLELSRCAADASRVL
jgi:transcriptional regulator with XRE-family HTH domain